VVVAVRDLDAAAQVWEAILGRAVAVRSRHPRGTRNALFVFDSGPYLELLAPWDAPESGTSARALRGFIEERGEGLFGLALTSFDITAAARRLRTLGFEAPEPVANSGTNEDGRVRSWRGTTIPETAGDHSFMVEHTGWDWRSELRSPPLGGRLASGASAIHHVAFDVEDAGAASHAWEARFGLPLTSEFLTEHMGARVHVHQAGEATIEFVAATRPDGAVGARIARRGHGLFGLALLVPSLEAAVAALREAGAIIGDPESGVLPHSRVARIDPVAASGVSVQFIHFD
jgi:catechol 2,3-dioxygenase-like lactoylglutathione lyase family enzyme